MGEQGALGLAGGAGGVDDVGQIVRTQAGNIWRAGIIVLCVRVVVQGQHAHAQHGAAGRQTILQIGAGQHCTWATVFQQEGQTFAGQFRIQRHIRRAGLERGEHRDHLVNAARQIQRDPTLQANASTTQTLSKPIGARIQFGIAQGVRTLAHRDGIGRALHLRFEQAMDAGGRSQRRGLSDGEALQLRAFVGRQQRQCVQGCVRRLLQRLDQYLHALLHQCDDPLGADVPVHLHLYRETSGCRDVIDRDRQRIVVAIQSRQHFQAVPVVRLLRWLAGCLHRAAANIAIVEQCGEQRRRRRDAATALRQCQWSVFVMEQLRQLLLGLADCFGDAASIASQADRERVEEHAQDAVGAAATLHAAEQGRAEYNIVLAAGLRQHQCAGQMEQAGGTDAELACMLAHRAGQDVGQRLQRLFDVGTGAAHVPQVERSGGRLQIAQVLGEEGAVFGLAHPQACVGDEVAERQRRRQLRLLSMQMRLHFLDQQLQCRVIHHQVMAMQAEQPACVRGIFDEVGMDQRCTADIQTEAAGVHAFAQRVQDIGIFDDVCLQRQRRMPPDHLHRRTQSLPDEAGTQDVVTSDDRLQRRDEGIQVRAAVEGQYADVEIGIAFGAGQVMEQQTLLQWRQRIDVLHVGGAAVDGGHGGIDLGLAEFDQRQQLWRDARAIGCDAVGRDAERGYGGEGVGQVGQRGGAEQCTHLQLPALPTQAFDQTDCQQRMPAEGEEVVVPTYRVQTQQITPNRGDGLLDLALRCLIRMYRIGGAIRCRQCVAIQLAVRGQRQAIQLHISSWEHVIR